MLIHITISPDHKDSPFLSSTCKGKSLSIPEFNFDVASWEVGHVVDCSAVSQAMSSHGGFPDAILVRQEMKAVWSILVDGIATRKTKWVVIGSPGVGKSILTVLVCFHLARALKMPVFLARQLKGDGGLTGGVVAICIQPDGGVMAYPSSPYTFNKNSDNAWGAWTVVSGCLLYWTAGLRQKLLAGCKKCSGGSICWRHQLSTTLQAKTPTA
jgi:hypothetical protein